MKNMKKFVSLLLVLLMVLSATTVLANETEPTPATGNGSITINGVISGYDYEIYQLLDLESYDVEAGAYSYTVNADWTAFFNTDEAKAYFTVADDGYVTWIAANDDATVAAFAKIALAYAKANDAIEPVKSSKNASESTITFTGLDLGYYLVDSSVGALCGLTTTKPDATVNAKNGIPTISKQVKEDEGDWGSSNSADIGQVVEFKITINVPAGAENYVLHDKMSDGLDFDPDSVKVSLVRSGSSQEVASSNYTVKTTTVEDDCTFEVEFTKEFCDSLEKDDSLVVTYSAVLTADAVIAGDGNPNEAWLEFGDEHYTAPGLTTTKTYGFDLVKTDIQNNLIDGAEFKIYDAPTGGNIVAVVALEKDEQGNVTVYRRAHADEFKGEGEGEGEGERKGEGEVIVVKDGKVRVVGFDNGTYYLEETKTPAGYNQLTSRQAFQISDANRYASFEEGVFGVQVVNNSGTLLPETGGMGTTLFYACGGALVLAAVVLLVTKKRMSSAE